MLLHINNTENHKNRKNFQFLNHDFQFFSTFVLIQSNISKTICLTNNNVNQMIIVLNNYFLQRDNVYCFVFEFVYELTICNFNLTF